MARDQADREGKSPGCSSQQPILKYVGLDRFGRVVLQKWVKSGTSTDEFGYTYDRDGNRLTKGNAVNTAFGEVYMYDGLNQLASTNRGSGTRTQSFDYDAVGNRDGVTTNGTTQTYTANRQNEITGVSGATTPTYDANGNMTTDETGRQFAYDAWNKLKVVKNSGGTTLKTYTYDAMGRRVAETASGTTTDLYYSAGWQVLEEAVGGTTKLRYVWSPVYVDAMILRDRDTDANGTLDERLWVQQDANYNVTALVNASGAVVERYAYDAYGVATVMNASWTTMGSSAYSWVHLHQGGRLDATSSLYHFRYRDYSAALGRWVTMDPMGYGAGDVDLYRAYLNSPFTYNDFSGLAVCFKSIEMISTGPSIRGAGEGEAAIQASLGPVSGKNSAMVGFAVKITAEGDKITNAKVSQDVISAAHLTSVQGQSIYTYSSAGFGGADVSVSRDNGSRLLNGLGLIHEVLGGKFPGVWTGGSLGYHQDGTLHTLAAGRGGAFVPGIERTRGDIKVTDTSIAYDDFPGYDTLDPAMISKVHTQLLFRVTTTDQGGPTDGQRIVAFFSVQIHAEYNKVKGKYVLASSGVAPASGKWTEKLPALT